MLRPQKRLRRHWSRSVCRLQNLIQCTVSLLASPAGVSSDRKRLRGELFLSLLRNRQRRHKMFHGFSYRKKVQKQICIVCIHFRKVPAFERSPLNAHDRVTFLATIQFCTVSFLILLCVNEGRGRGIESRKESLHCKAWLLRYSHSSKQTLYLFVVLYAPSLALEAGLYAHLVWTELCFAPQNYFWLSHFTVAKLPLPASILTIGAVCTFYTSLVSGCE